jgi:hypothetical protein
VLPCRWGYKWVKWITQIIIVDYDYKGTYESYGLSDEAIRPNCTMLQTIPPISTFNVWKSKEYNIKILSNFSIEHYSSIPHERMLILNFTGKENARGYFYMIFPKELILKPYQEPRTLVEINQKNTTYNQIYYKNHVYMFFTSNDNNGIITIRKIALLLGSGLGLSKPSIKMT